MRVFVYEYLSTGAMAGQPGAASLTREGLAMLGAVVADLASCPGVETATMVSPDLAGWLRQETPRLAVHAVGPGEEESTFRHLARESDRALVIAPEFDDLLARRAEWVLEEGCVLLGPTPRAIRLAADKLRLARHLEQHSVPTPPTVSYVGGDSPFLREDVVVKPRFGAGAQATYLVSHPPCYPAIAERARADGWAGELLAQPAYTYHHTPASVAFLLGPEGAMPLLPCGQSIAYGDGARDEPVVAIRYEGGHLPLDQALHATAIDLAGRAVASVPGLQGYVGVDLLLQTNRAGRPSVVIEINPRLTTSYVGLRRLARFNVMRAMLAVLAAEPPGPLEYDPGPVTFLPNGTIQTGPPLGDPRPPA